MKKMKILMAALLVSVGVAAEEAEQARPLNVLMIGNSFSICVLEQLPQVAESYGKPLKLCSMFIPGCTIARHAENCGKEENAALYKVDTKINGKREKRFLSNIPAVLKSEKWDIVTLQQGSHASWLADTYEPHSAKVIETIRKFAPNAEIVIQETWSYTPWDERLAKWGIDQNKMYDELHKQYAALAQRYGNLRVIPVGTAVQIFRRELPVKYTENSFGGDPCGDAKFVAKPEGGYEPKGDVFHLNRTGHYLQALVWAEVLFGVDATKCDYAPKFVEEDVAVKMRAAAHAAVASLKR